MSDFILPPMIGEHNFMLGGRLAGNSWQDIHGFLGERKGAALNAGYTDADWRDYWGKGDHTAMKSRLRAAALRNMAADDNG